jgi:hypothetical protein
MKHIHRTLIVILFLCLVADIACADLSTRFRAGVGVLGDYAAKIRLVYGGDVASLEYEAEYRAVPIGATIIYNDWLYIDVSYQGASGDATFSEETATTDFARDDLTSTVGVRWRQLTGYLGYKYGRSETVWLLPGVHDRFTSKGVVAGLGYAFTLPKGAITVSGGVGSLEGEYFIEGAGTLPMDRTLGYSASLGYQVPFAKRWSASVEYRINRYSYEIIDSSLDEEFSQATLSLAATF